MSDQDPKFKETRFKCPHSNCGVVAQQNWFDEESASETVTSLVNHLYYNYRSSIFDYDQNAVKGFVDNLNKQFPQQYRQFIPSKFAISTCLSCNDITLWVDQEVVYPMTIAIAPPNDDLNDDIKDLYTEAGRIYKESAKGATALLRMALQKLLKQVGKDGKNINNDIKELVEEGLSPEIQRALDLLRVVGNNAVHPGQINIDDNKEIALKLFDLLNFIARELITKPKELENLYIDIVPEQTKEHINQRDKN